MKNLIVTILSLLALHDVYALQSEIRVIEINDNIIAFYTGRDDKRISMDWNWLDDGAMKLGIATYAIHSGDKAVVWDSFTSVEQAQWVRDYMETRGIKRFTLFLSHWHPDHIAGNAVYSDSDIIASAPTYQAMAKFKEGLENGTLLGPPGIKPLVLPTVGYEKSTHYYLNDIVLQVFNINIHSVDSTVMYLPKYKTLLAGDTLEDTITYIAEPESLPEHVNNLGELLEIENYFGVGPLEHIYPNHGDPKVIATGGYNSTLIQATMAYIMKMVLHSRDDDYLEKSLKFFIQDSLDKGWLNYFAPYEEAHRENLQRVQEFYKGRPLPDFEDIE